MSTPVYTETVESRDHIADMLGGRVPADRKTSVFVHRDKVCMTGSTLVVGVPNGHPDKRYYKWITTTSFGFFRNRAGNPQPYAAFRSWDSNRKTPWKHRNAVLVFSLFGNDHKDTGGGRAFIHGCWEAFGCTSLEQFYPMAGEYGLPSYAHMPYNLRPAMRQPDWESFATCAFGKTRTTPRLVAAVKNTEPYIVALAHQFRGVVEDETLVKFMEDNHFDDEMEEEFELHNPNVRKIALALGRDSATEILRRGLDLTDTNRIRVMTGPLADWHMLRAKKRLTTITSWSDLV